MFFLSSLVCITSRLLISSGSLYNLPGLRFSLQGVRCRLRGHRTMGCSCIYKRTTVASVPKSNFSPPRRERIGFGPNESESRLVLYESIRTIRCQRHRCETSANIKVGVTLSKLQFRGTTQQPRMPACIEFRLVTLEIGKFYICNENYGSIKFSFGSEKTFLICAAAVPFPS